MGESEVPYRHRRLRSDFSRMLTRFEEAARNTSLHVHLQLAFQPFRHHEQDVSCHDCCGMHSDRSFTHAYPLSGYSEDVKCFAQLGREAGTLLPMEFKPNPAIFCHPHPMASNATEPLLAWVEFLVVTKGSYFTFQGRVHDDTLGWDRRGAKLMTDISPFFLSCIAIEQYLVNFTNENLAAYLNEREILRELVEYELNGKRPLAETSETQKKIDLNRNEASSSNSDKLRTVSSEQFLCIAEFYEKQQHYRDEGDRVIFGLPTNLPGFATAKEMAFNRFGQALRAPLARLLAEEAKAQELLPTSATTQLFCAPKGRRPKYDHVKDSEIKAAWLKAHEAMVTRRDFCDDHPEWKLTVKKLKQLLGRCRERENRNAQK